VKVIRRVAFVLVLADPPSKLAIERDAADPHFLANLNKLGPVRVDHMQNPIRAV
jgi:hypothetical protein